MVDRPMDGQYMVNWPEGLFASAVMGFHGKNPFNGHSTALKDLLWTSAMMPVGKTHFIVSIVFYKKTACILLTSGDDCVSQEHREVA